VYPYEIFVVVTGESPTGGGDVLEGMQEFFRVVQPSKRNTIHPLSMYCSCESWSTKLVLVCVSTELA
jgi:hypothetical protein